MRLGFPVLDGFPEVIETTVDAGRVRPEGKEVNLNLQLRSAKPICLRGARRMPGSSSAPAECCQASIQIQNRKGYVFFQTSQCEFIFHKIPQLKREKLVSS